MRHLMTHRAGFEETIKNFYTFDPERGLALARYVREHTPERIYPAGSVPAYSNYGTALAGYLVERISNEPFEDYVERHIFAPLKMSHSTFRQPAPLASAVSKGYGSADGAPVPFEIFNPSPAGAMSTTAADMARFMVAHLEIDDPSRNPLLSPATMQLMHEHAAGDRRLNGMALGFRESSRNGRRIIGHGGDTFAFHTDLLLLPDERVGLFVSFNSRGTNDAVYAMRRALAGEFLDRYFPASEKAQTPVVRASNGLSVEGLFESSRRWETSFLRLLNMLGQESVTAQPDGTIEISTVRQINGRPKRWRETASADWREIDGEDRLLGDVRDSRVVSLMRSEDPATVLLRAPSWRASSWGLPLLLIAVMIVGATMIAPLVAAAVRRHLGVVSILNGRDLYVARAVWLFAVTAIVLVGGWAMVFAPLIEQRVDFFNESLDPWLRALQVLGAVQLVSVPVSARSVWLAWTSQHSWLCKLRRIAILAAFTIIAWYLIVFGFITTGVRY
jgi:hypothetical protein